jgi:hypothetical protein
MKWFKKKGLCFSLGLEILAGVICFAGSIAVIAGYIVEAVIGAVILAAIGIFAAGGDVSV